MGKAVHAFESYGIEAAIWNRDDRNRRPAGRRRTGDEIPPAIEKNGIGGREAEHYRRHDSVVSRLDSAQLGHRSEEHTSELQSQSNLVCRLRLEKKKLASRMAATASAPDG